MHAARLRFLLLQILATAWAEEPTHHPRTLEMCRSEESCGSTSARSLRRFSCLMPGLSENNEAEDRMIIAYKRKHQSLLRRGSVPAWHTQHAYAFYYYRLVLCTMKFVARGNVSRHRSPLSLKICVLGAESSVESICHVCGIDDDNLWRYWTKCWTTHGQSNSEIAFGKICFSMVSSTNLGKNGLNQNRKYLSSAEINSGWPWQIVTLIVRIGWATQPKKIKTYIIVNFQSFLRSNNQTTCSGSRLQAEK